MQQATDWQIRPGINESLQFSSVQLLSPVWLFATPWTAACQASLSITNSQSVLKLMPIESVMPSDHLILCCPLLLLPSIFPSIRVFSTESVLRIRWPMDWSFSLSISPSNENLGLISFRMDWLDLLAVQENLKSLLQHHGSKASILLCSAFFIVQLSQPYMTVGKTMALTRCTFVGKVMSLLFNMLSRLVMAFLPRSQRFYRDSWRWGSHAGLWWAPICLGCPQVRHMYNGDRSRPQTHTHSWTSELMCLLVQKIYERWGSLAKRKVRADLKMCSPAHMQHTQSLLWDKPYTGTKTTSQLT